MPCEPPNAAAARVIADVPRYGDRGFVQDGVRGLLAPDFVREDQRRLIALPTVDGDGWIDQLLSLFELGSGRMTMAVDEIVAVRGHRLVLFWSALVWEGGDTHRILGIAQYDRDVRLVERYVSFDDVATALVALDEIAAELVGNTDRPDTGAP